MTFETHFFSNGAYRVLKKSSSYIYILLKIVETINHRVMQSYFTRWLNELSVRLSLSSLSSSSSSSSNSGCVEPGQVVCGDITNPNGLFARCIYRRCVLLNEDTNLWKKSAMTTVPIGCLPGSGPSRSICNSNRVIYQALGLAKHQLHTVQLCLIY